MLNKEIFYFKSPIKSRYFRAILLYNIKKIKKVKRNVHLNNNFFLIYLKINILIFNKKY